MLTQAFIQEEGNGRLTQESALVTEELTRRGVPVTLFTAKRIHRRQLPLDCRSFVAGDMKCVIGALKQLQIDIPASNTYPKSLWGFLQRRVWRSDLRKLESSLLNGLARPVFAKPANRDKHFTGRVFRNEEDLYHVSGVSRNEEIWCSEVVEWVTEYRVYVVNGEIRYIDFYTGERDVPLDRTTVEKIVASLEQTEESTRGYGVDLGVLQSGETALVEWNDGLALGAYSIGSKDYTDLVWARWEQLLGEPRRSLKK